MIFAFLCITDNKTINGAEFRFLAKEDVYRYLD